MSMRNYGIYQQGAIFFQEDFDPVKVILAVCEKILELTLPDKIKTALSNNEFSVEVATELCGMLDIELEDAAPPLDYSFISNKLIPEAEYYEWFEEPDPLMGTDEAGVFIYSDIEGEYVYDNEVRRNELVEDCYMFSLYFPLVWEIYEYKGCRTREDVLKHIREAAKSLLKDDIDWDKRLGVLIGGAFG